MGLVAKCVEHIPNSESPKVVIKSVNPEYQACERIAEEVNVRRSCHMGSEATVMVGINPIALGAAKWIGTGAGVSGAILIALNLGIVVYGFALFLLSSLLWGSVALVQREPSLAGGSDGDDHRFAGSGTARVAATAAFRH